MTMLRRAVRPTILATLATLALCGPGSTETRPVGVVASLQGTATVERTAVAEPAPLKFRDDVFVRDRITTGERSVVRILLGGKATVTAREHSVLVITERPGTSTVSLAEGKIAVAVDKTRMRQGEVVEIRTPNAVAAIRGTVVVAEVVPGDGGPASTITVLRGLIDVTRLDAAGRPVGRPVDVGALQQIGVTRALSPVRTIPREAAGGLGRSFSVIPREAPAASMQPLIRAAVANAARDLTRTLPPVATPGAGVARGRVDGSASSEAGAGAASGVSGASGAGVPGGGNAFGAVGGGPGSGTVGAASGTVPAAAGVPGAGSVGAPAVAPGAMGNGNALGVVSGRGSGNAYGVLGGGPGKGKGKDK
ncbi:MAG: hypothetical protein A3E31_08085 [Candidatus Rokubacteria bacterium RIFCSPHIGHO2_12_FULL_73_22]|nr:MAG: hypothetical protein A3E31_08085 [Candidatus Rokubacteria bacterium RIFCSPHIGHO2_12_FULL_73_22]